MNITTTLPPSPVAANASAGGHTAPRGVGIVPEEMSTAELASISSLAFLLCMAIVGNALSLYIFTRRHLRQCSINILLAALSLNDLVYAALAFVVYPVMPLCPFIGCGVTYTRFVIVIHPLITMCHCTSTWLLVAITVERWLAVCKPFLVGQYCTRRRTYLLIGVTVAFSVAYNLIRFWEYGYDAAQQSIKAQLRAEDWYMFFYQILLTTVLLYVVPLAGLCVFNFQVATEIHRSKESHKHLTQQQRKDHRIAQMMLYVVLVFVVCYTFSLCLGIVEFINADLFKTSFGHLLNEINNVFVVLSAALNCLLYCRFSSRYWAEVVKLWTVVLHPCTFRQHWQSLEAQNTVVTRTPLGMTRDMTNGGAGHTFYSQMNDSSRGGGELLSSGSRGLISRASNATAPPSYRWRRERDRDASRSTEMQPMASHENERKTTAPPPTQKTSPSPTNNLLVLWVDGRPVTSTARPRLHRERSHSYSECRPTLSFDTAELTSVPVTRVSRKRCGTESGEKSDLSKDPNEVPTEGMLKSVYDDLSMYTVADIEHSDVIGNSPISGRQI